MKKEFKYDKAYRDRLIFVISLAFLSFSSCKKALEIAPPVNGLIGSVVYSNNNAAAAAVTGIYAQMANAGFSDGTGSFSLRLGLSADELTNYNSGDPDLSGIYANNLNVNTKYFWTELYQKLYAANAAIEGLTKSTAVSATLKTQLLGEAKFLRAFFLLYTVNVYGNVPLVTTTNYQVNNMISQSSTTLVYQQIVADLLEAQADLGNVYTGPLGTTTTERVRPDKATATALLARVYLYTGKFVDAETQATSLINNTASYHLCQGLDSVFLKNNTEAIWQLQSVVPGVNTYDAYAFILTSAPGPGSQPVAMSNNLYNTFEPGDKRLTHWISSYTSGSQTYYYPNKYKAYIYNQPLTEYTTVLRLAEQYLIRAEARAQQGKLIGTGSATEDLNIIRNRAGLLATTASGQAALLTAILHERQVELFTEWGHRWLDLKRTGTVNTVMSTVTPQKGGSWTPDAALYPIPQSEILINHNLTQNPGYH